MPGRTRWAAATLALVPLLGACAGPSGPATPTGGPSTSQPPEPPAPPKSAVVGRHYDFGTIRKIETVNGVQVVILDRWTVKKLADATLARDGIPVAKYRLKKSPYTNENTKVTFRIPVAQDPMVVLRHCLAWDEPLQAKSTTLAQLAKASAADSLVVVGLDDRGWLVSAQNLPGC
jgi:hypothetical protein